MSPTLVRYSHWPEGRVAWVCAACGLLRSTPAAALACCQERATYDAAVRDACWPVSSDPTVTRRRLARLRRDFSGSGTP